MGKSEYVDITLLLPINHLYSLLVRTGKIMIMIKMLVVKFKLTCLGIQNEKIDGLMNGWIKSYPQSLPTMLNRLKKSNGKAILY